MTRTPHDPPALPDTVLLYEGRSSHELVPIVRVLAAVGVIYGVALVVMACVDAPRVYGYLTKPRFGTSGPWVGTGFFVWEIGNGLGGALLAVGALRMMTLGGWCRRLFVMGCGTTLASGALGWSCYFFNVLSTPGVREHSFNYIHNAFNAVRELSIPLLLMLLITCRPIRRVFP